MTDARTVGLVALGGAVGTALRSTAVRIWPVGATSFPTTILVVNVLGAAALGALVALVARHRPHDRTFRPLLGIGVLGGFTTFSTLAVDAARLGRHDRLGLAVADVVASLALGLAAAALGARLVHGPLGDEGES